MALITTVGASNADSYITTDAADVYMAASAYETAQDWELLTEDQKNRALQLAALVLNMFPYRGAKACREQRLEFPRWWRTDDGYPASEDDYITYADISGIPPTVPQEIKDAQCEVAFQAFCQVVFKAEIMAFPERDIKSFGLGGSLNLEFTDSVGSVSVLSKARMTTALVIQTLLWKWVRHTGGGVV